MMKDNKLSSGLDSCPVCGGKIVARCRCMHSDSFCENKHEWFYCLAHKPSRLVIGKSDHSIDIGKCVCKQLSDEEVGARIQARVGAELIMVLAVEESETHRFCSSLFWQHLHNLICEKGANCIVKRQSKISSAMTDKEAREFGQTMMEFGQYEGQKFDDVPMDYLEWIAERKLIDQLRRYLKSKRICEEME